MGQRPRLEAAGVSYALFRGLAWVKVASPEHFLCPGPCSPLYLISGSLIFHLQSVRSAVLMERDPLLRPQGHLTLVPPLAAVWLKVSRLASLCFPLPCVQWRAS